MPHGSNTDRNRRNRPLGGVSLLVLVALVMSTTGGGQRLWAMSAAQQASTIRQLVTSPNRVARSVESRQTVRPASAYIAAENSRGFGLAAPATVRASQVDGRNRAAAVRLALMNLPPPLA